MLMILFNFLVIVKLDMNVWRRVCGFVYVMNWKLIVSVVRVVE